MHYATDEKYRWRGFRVRLAFFGTGVLLFLQAWRNFDGHFLTPWTIAFIVCVVSIIILEVILARTYKCPSCGVYLKEPKIDEHRSNEYYLECVECDTRWYTKTFLPND